MAGTNVNALEKVASMSVAERELNNSSSDFTDFEKKGNVTASHDAMPQRPVDVESIDSDQPAGLLKMEAITLVWTKKWLVAAYVLYVSTFDCAYAPDV